MQTSTHFVRGIPGRGGPAPGHGVGTEHLLRMSVGVFRTARTLQFSGLVGKLGQSEVT